MANRSDLARWESAAGAGYDAAGRTVYTGPGMMYMGPGDNAATKAVHQGLVNDTNMDDGEGLIRALLQDISRRKAMAGNLNYKLPDLATASGNRTINLGAS
jgi:hypothetical protein